MASRKSKRDERLGQRKQMNCGSFATIIEYKNANHMTIQFDDGTISKATWTQWEKGQVLNHSLEFCCWKQREQEQHRQNRLGEKRIMNCGEEATIIEYLHRHDITVQFPDGSINAHKSYGEFLSGEIQCLTAPKLHNCSKVRSLNCKKRREGLRAIMNCGMECEVIEYRNSHNRGITVRFADGNIVVADWHNFKNGGIHNQNLPRCNSVNNSIGEQKIAEFLNNYKIEFIRQKTFSDLKSDLNNFMFFDFYLPKNNLLIEYQGEFHDGTPYKKNPNGIQTKEKWESQMKRDALKRKWANSHNMKLLEIWYWDRDNIENILKEVLCLC